MRLELFTFDIFLPLFGAREPAVCACGWVRMRSCTCVCMRQSSCAQPLRSSVRGAFVGVNLCSPASVCVHAIHLFVSREMVGEVYDDVIGGFSSSTSRPPSSGRGSGGGGSATSSRPHSGSGSARTWARRTGAAKKEHNDPEEL